MHMPMYISMQLPLLRSVSVMMVGPAKIHVRYTPEAASHEATQYELKATELQSYRAASFTSPTLAVLPPASSRARQHSRCPPRAAS